MELDEEERWLLIGCGGLTALANLSDSVRSVRAGRTRALAPVLASHPECAIHGGEVQLPARSVAIVRDAARDPGNGERTRAFAFRTLAGS